MEVVKKRCALTREACVEIDEEIRLFCEKMRIERRDGLKTRLSAEDCLTYWMDHGAGGNTVTLRVGMRLLTPMITLEMEGNTSNPFEEELGEFGNYLFSLQTGLNMKPEYSYARGRNRLVFRPKRKSVNPLVRLLLILLLGVGAGMLGMLLPPSARESLLNVVVHPVYNAFFRLLGIVAGPMIFLTTVWGIYGIGDVDTLGRVGKKLFMRCVRAVFLAACFGALAFPLLGPGFAPAAQGAGRLSDISELILDIIPPNFVAPFYSGNTLQIIFLALLVGVGLVYLGKKTETIARGVEQVHSLVRFLMNIIGKLLPFLVFLVAIRIIWSGALEEVGSVWKLVLVHLAAVLAVTLSCVLYTARRRKVRVGTLVKKMIPPFSVALSTASSSAALPVNSETCKKNYGIDASLSDFGLPLATVLYRPLLALFFSLVVYYFAGKYQVACTPVWLAISVVICAAMAIAAPPIPGGSAIVYTLLFAQMGIPEEAIALGLTLDLIFDFLNTALTVALMGPFMVNTASDLDMIDPEVLRSA